MYSKNGTSRQQTYPVKQIAATQHFERQLRENEFQQMLTAQKIAAAMKNKVFRPGCYDLLIFSPVAKPE
ncbi:hypothetical protein [Flavobacterium noncentrifugens]|uniref:hypothetical protein n=1 Tax=Flavobacterium noncentrifugens TaxID=1128970 RepID=UPI000B80A65F|nr:hypothetical protein [Flavobacterium noncentrifugens]